MDPLSFFDHDRRRSMVKAILSPPSVSLSFILEKGKRFEGRQKKTNEDTRHSNEEAIKPCCLCHFEESPCPFVGDPLVAETLRTMMKQVVGLDLDQDLTFCTPCLTQLQNLVSLKREMDGLGERLVTMIIGLRTLFSASTQEVPVGQNDCQTNSALVNKTPRPRRHRRQMLPRFPCSICNKVFKTQSHLKQHSVVHLPTRERPFACPLCSDRFTQKKNMERHAINHRPLEERTIPCPHCPRRFAKKDSLMKHVLRHVELSQTQIPHEAPRKPGRPKKNKDCKDQEVGVADEGVRGSSLVECHTPKLNSTLTHQRKNQKKGWKVKFQTQKCTLCSDIIQKRNYHKHLNVHKNATLRCSYCSGRFAKSSQRLRHIERSHFSQHQEWKLQNENTKLMKNKPLQKVKCEVCSEVLQDFYRYTMHRQLHKGAKLPCPEGCKGKFPSYSRLEAHSRNGHHIIAPSRGQVSPSN